MSRREGTGPYAKALLQVCVEEGDAHRAAKELEGFWELLHRHAALEATLVNPAVTADAKRKIVVELCDRMGFQAPVRNLLAHMAAEGKTPLIRSLVGVYRARLRVHERIVDAEVTTAVPLTSDRAAALQASLATATGKQVTMTTKVDPSIMGGVIARVGSTVFDGSVTRQLERMRLQLREGA